MSAFGKTKVSFDNRPFNFTCCDPPVKVQPFRLVRKETPLVSYNKMLATNCDTDKLIGMRVDCTDIGLLTSWHLVVLWSEKEWFYEYTCAAFKDPGSFLQCSSHATSEDYNGGWDWGFMDRHWAQCPEMTFMAAFEVQQGSDDTKVKYSFDCCGFQVDLYEMQMTGKRLFSSLTTHKIQVLYTVAFLFQFK